MWLRSFLTIFILLSSSFAYADTVTLSEVDETRAQAIFREVRCPVCVAQPIAESDASLSGQMRDRIRLLIKDGQTDMQILDTLAQTYGDDIRLDPRREGRTALLWATPWLVVLFGLIIIVRSSRRKNHDEDAE